MFRTSRYIFLLLSAAIVIGSAFRIALSYLSIKNLPPSSDDAIAQLLAESISKGESLPLLFTGQPYQFPIEAYLMSVFVESFQPNAFAARIQLIVLAVVTLVILSVVAIKLFKLDGCWPTLLLLLIPSAYWLIHQSGYFVPQYTVSALLAALIFYLAIKINQSEDSSLISTSLVGVICGFAVSNHLLIVSVVVGALTIVVFSGKPKHSVVRIGTVALGLLIGLVPYLIAVFTIEGAYDAISSRTNISILFNRLYNVVIGQALPGAMGLYPPYYPDYPVHINWGVPLRLLFIGSYLSILLCAFVIRAVSFFPELRKRRWPSLAWPDMFIIVSLISLALMAINTRSQADDHRYLLPVVWSFPFLLGYLYSLQKGKLQWLIGGYVVILVVINITTTIDILNEWNQPAKIQHHADTENIDQIVEWMQANDISHCYATFWLAYRFTYETEKEIVCAPVYNERFNGWPIPYKHQVDQNKNVTFIMSNTYGTKFSSFKFEKIMDEYEIKYERQIFDPYYIYYDFEYEPAVGEVQLSEAVYEISTNIKNVETSDLIDRNIMKSWQMKEDQQAGQYVEIKFEQQQFVQRLDIVHPLKIPHPAETIRVWGQINNVRIPLTENIDFNVDRLRFENNHPIFGEYLQTIRFSPQWLDAVRIELVEPHDGKPWTLSEIRVGIQTKH